jgi:hypothetical protein
MKPGDLVFWDYETRPGSPKKRGLYRVRSAPRLPRNLPRHEEPTLRVAMSWLGGFRMYRDQHRAFRPVTELRLIEDEDERVEAILEFVPNAMGAIALIASETDATARRASPRVVSES